MGSFEVIVALIALMVVLMVVAGILLARRIAAEKAERDTVSRIEAELALAKRLQSAMLPQTETDNPQLRVSAIIVPARNVAGDLYYYFVRNGYLYFCIGDVSGKGLPASLFMSKTVSLFVCISRYAIRADDIAEQLNIELCQNNASNMFVTMFIGILNMATGELQYCNAGHDEPLLWEGDGSGKPHYLSTSDNVPLGVDEEEPYRQGEMLLSPGARLFLYTDGVTEAKRKDLEMYGEERLLGCFTGHLLADRLTCESVLADVRAFVNGNEQSDDITMLSIDVKCAVGQESHH